MAKTLKFLFSLVVCILLGMQALSGQAVGSLFGSVHDPDTDEGIPYATVTALNAAGNVVNGAIADEDGQFKIGNLPSGQYSLRVQIVMYQDTVLAPMDVAAPKATGPVRIVLREPKMGPEVVITDQVDYAQNKIDRKVYAVDRNMVTQGGSASELLNTIPSVEVDIDGQISLRGNANVTVFIDGKPSTLTGGSRSAILDQFPASTIKSIEVITHPSAKYDPDGTAGIINIITKKDSRNGLNGNISVGIGTNNKYNGAGALNYRHKKFFAYANYSYRRENRWNEGEAEVFTSDDTLSPFQLQSTSGNRISNEHLVKAGIDFYLSPHATLGIVATTAANRRNGNEASDFIESSPSQLPLFRYLRSTTEVEPTRNLEGEINFQHRPAKEGRQLDMRVSLAQNTEEDGEQYITDSLDLAGTPTGVQGPIQYGTTPTAFVLGTAQIDYARPLSAKNKLEVGAKSTLRNINTSYIFGSRADAGAEFVFDSTISNVFQYQEQVHAGYLILGRNMGKLSAEAGLRAEQALTGFTLLNNDSSYTNNYFNLFPSGHLAYRKSDKHEFRAAYSKRINRPETDDLNPFTEYANPKRLRRGNPQLQPEYIHSLEFNHSLHLSSGNLSTTAYYRRLLNTVSRTVQSAGGDTLVVTSANMLNGHSYGLELIAQAQPAKWFDLTISANLFRTIMDASNITPGLSLINNGVDGRIFGTANLSKRWSLQSTYNYKAPRQGPQGQINARHSMDAALKHTFMKGKANLTLRVSDIFNTMHFQIYTEADGVVSDFYRKRESRIGFLTFSMRFGQEGKSQKKVRKEEQENSGSGFDF